MEAIHLGFVVWPDFMGFSGFRGGGLAGFCRSEVVWLDFVGFSGFRGGGLAGFCGSVAVWLCWW